MKAKTNLCRLERINKQNVPSYLRGYNAQGTKNERLLTVSAIVDYLRCPRCAYLKHVLYIPSPTNIQSVRGCLYHQAYEWFFSQEADFVSMLNLEVDETSIIEDFNARLLELKNKLEHYFQSMCKKSGIDYELEWLQLRIKLEEKFQRWVSSIKIALANGSITTIEAADLVPERKFEVFLSAPALSIRGGKIDMIEGMHPIEIKTGKAPINGVNLWHALQVTWYALLIEHRFGIDVDYGEVYYAQVDERRSIVVDTRARTMAFELRDSALEAFKKPVLPSGRCSRCTSRTLNEQDLGRL